MLRTGTIDGKVQRASLDRTKALLCLAGAHRQGTLLERGALLLALPAAALARALLGHGS